jgi:hypothetical protein
MELRDLTINEIFPLAYQQDLLKKQSEHFTNQSISKMSIADGYQNLPTKLLDKQGNNLSIIQPNPPGRLFGNYIKNNWKPLLLVFVAGGILIYTVIESNNYRKIKQKID